MSEPSEAVLPVVGICAAREQAHWSFWDQPAHLVADKSAILANFVATARDRAAAAEHAG
ncbi:MAG TPA: hypothetical protein VNB88_03910 [Gaiellaceae bacterium]|jgi:hypothetical protein|nr:hypothetical protein [Gaiellaceae bacterium]